MKNNILDYFEESVNQNPFKTAVLDSKYSYSYQELQDTAKRIAMNFTNHNKKPIIVLCKRQVQCIALFWGIIYSGNFYVPLDDKIPLDRLDSIIESTESNDIVVFDNSAKIQNFCKSRTLNFWNIDSLLDNTLVDDNKLLSIRRLMLDIDPLYMVYTSGSTGKPKGVIKTQRSMICFMNSFHQTFSLDADDVLGNQANFDFDVAAKDIFLSVYLGSTMVIIPKLCFTIPKELISFLNTHKVTTLIWAVAAVRFVANSGILEKERPLFLKRVFFSGEILQPNDLRKWYKHLNDVTYVNLYAPSEVTGNCLYYIVEDIEHIQHIPLGKTFPNINIMILNGGHKIENGEIGEILVRGSFLASGYYNNPEQTAQNFVQNPLNKNYPEIVYKTGDLATIKNGQIYFVGRVDSQIKHMGHRIELEEIEQVLYDMSSSTLRCCALLDKEKNIIVLLYQGAELSTKELRSYYIDKLPQYMIPHRFINVANLPENERGKLDRFAVEQLYIQIYNAKEDIQC